MARGSKEVKPLFDDKSSQEDSVITSIQESKSKKNEEQSTSQRKEKKAVPSNLTKYQKQPKYKTHVPHNIRIPKEMRADLEKIAKKLKIPLGKNTGFFQEFTIDALWPAIEKAKKDLDIDE